MNTKQATLRLDLSEIVLGVVTYGRPQDILEIYQGVKFALSRKVEEKEAEIRKSLPPIHGPWFKLEGPRGEINYDQVAALLVTMEQRGKVKSRKNTRGDLEYSLV